MIKLLTHFRFLNWKLLKRMLWNQILVWCGKNRLRNVQMGLTYRCNHQCLMCSSNKLLDKKQADMTLPEWCRTVDQLYDLGCTHFDLTGGEPTLKGRWWLRELIQHINRKGDCLVSLATNGSLITPAFLRTLKAAGLNSVLFDVQPGEHDKIVGAEGNLRHIKEMIAEARAVDLNVCINTCLGSHNKDQFEELLKWTKKENLHVLTNLAAPTGRLSGESVRMSEFRRFYYRLMKKYPLMRSDTTYNYFKWNSCPGGREKLYITAYGEVLMCTFNQISYGNVLNKPLESIYRKMLSNPWIKAKYICKHTFWPQFRDWADGEMEGKKLPVEYKE